MHFLRKLLLEMISNRHTFICIIVESFRTNQSSKLINRHVEKLDECYLMLSLNNMNLSQNAKPAYAKKDTGLDQSPFPVQLFHFWIENVYKRSK